MEITSESNGYEESLGVFEKLLDEQRDRHLWLFLYSSRHAQLKLHQTQNFDERDQLIDCSYYLLEKFNPTEFKKASSDLDFLTRRLLEFCFGITYAFHKRNFLDGFYDIRLEPALPELDIFLSSLTPQEFGVVARLHELTYEYGFVILELWLGLLSSKELLDASIIKFIENKQLSLVYPNFTFMKKGNHPKGIQIAFPEFRTAVSENWDLKIFINKKDKLFHIKKRIKDAWKSSEIQTLGDEESHLFTLYVDRSICSQSHVLSIIDAQTNQLESYLNPLFERQASKKDRRNLKKSLKSHTKEAKKQLANDIDRLRLSEGMMSKRWDTPKNNIRRAVGLYLWDAINIVGAEKNRKKLISDLIDELKFKCPEVLELYLSNINKHISPEKTLKFGDTANAISTVIREMNADYDLTSHCIQQADYLTPYQAKNSGQGINMPKV